MNIPLLQATRKKERANPGASPADQSADCAEALDIELPRPPALVGTRGRRLLWMVGLLALFLRILLLPLGHWWDITIDYNVFIDLVRNHSPYDTFTALSHIARAAGWDDVYEYYAYPPVPLYIYYPLAKIYALLHPHANYFFVVSGTYAVPNLTLDFFFLLKAPIWIADFLIAALLARMSGTVRSARDYLLNPYVLMVSGAWTFDAIMVLGLVAGVYFILRGKMIWAGIALAFGTMVKFFPAIAVPTMLIYLIKKKRPLREIVIFLVAYGVACLVFLGPFINGFLTVLNFHSSRPGGGMTWMYYWTTTDLFSNPDGVRVTLDTLSSFGTPILAIALLLSYWYILKTEMTLNRMMVVTLLGFFVGSKLINEQYVLMLIPFLWLEAYRLGGVWRWFYRLFWIVPLAFALFHVPLDRFFWLFYHMILKDKADFTVTGVTGFEWSMFPWKHQLESERIVLVLAITFFTLAVVALLWPVRWPARIPRSSQQPGSDAPQDAFDKSDADAEPVSVHIEDTLSSQQATGASS